MKTAESQVKQKKYCRHLKGYWIDKRRGNFRCLGCGCQFFLRDLPAWRRDIEAWEE